jgi:glycyl-tRNA synthetase
MFKTHVGAVQSEESVAYLRPETAQGIFLNFKNVLDTMRVRLPFGIAQVGRAFRNEVTPRNFIFRSREFEQMEIEWFCHPSEARKWYEFWCEQRRRWWESIGLKGESINLRSHGQDELAHYARGGCGTFDLEYRFPFSGEGFDELEGVAHRTDFDLRQHQLHSKTKLEYFDQERGERYLPHVIEPSAGLSRGVLAVLCEAYTADQERPSLVYLKFHPRLAPITAGVFPLVNKDGMSEVARKLYDDLRYDYTVQFDVKQTIGKRYARMDEAGTPWCFTVDGDTLVDQTVTVRDRDTTRQERIHIDRVRQFLRDRI